jgi:hypothetical protein
VERGSNPMGRATEIRLVSLEGGQARRTRWQYRK